MSDFRVSHETRVIGRLEDMPIVRFRRLYAVMLHPWFPWRLRKWVERNFISRWNDKRFRVEHSVVPSKTSHKE